MTDELRTEWEALLDSRRRNNVSGQDGADLQVFLESRIKQRSPGSHAVTADDLTPVES